MEEKRETGQMIIFDNVLQNMNVAISSMSEEIHELDSKIIEAMSDIIKV